MPKSSSNKRGSSSRNSNQSLMSDWGDTARERPLTTAAAAAGAVAAGVFLWSKRNEISDQIGRLSDQITDWAEDMRSNMSGSSSREMALTEGPNESSAIESSRTTAARSGRSSTSRSRSGSARATGGQSSTAGANINAGSSSPGIAH